MCPYCSSPFVLDVQHPQTVLAHLGAHILHDPKVNRNAQPCGLCGGPSRLCRFFLKKSHSAGGGMTVNMEASKGCSNLVKKFNYSTAAKSSSQNSPCSNVQLRCPECDSSEPTVWRYNLRYHLQNDHPQIPITRHAHLWGLSDNENTWMLALLTKIKEGKEKRTKKVKPALAISTAHSSKLALRSV
ncbi:hypothetical protein B0H16DRAFT_1308743 [Mycena metata]|uniref:Uncharacterized protein n=1 Tax=Mycena metata TaxID=1033252 RepID=A0AAD7JPG9_9AGAR|nr:hypothetical protein B0H16DRAFT_1308743 [Mycena metata]